jgi:hypothetical protein
VSRLVGGSLAKGLEPTSAEHYFERVAKYVPIEIVAAYLALQTFFAGVANGAVPLALQIFVYLAFIGLTIGYLRAIGGDVHQKRAQIVIGTIAFVVWSYAIGGPFFWKAIESASETQLVYPFLQFAAVLLWTLGAGLFEPKPR